MNTIRRALLAGLLLAQTPVFSAPPPKGQISAEHYQQTVTFLASDRLKGRLTGSPELEKAAAYLAGQFKALGIPPAAGSTYLQRFQVTTKARLGKTNHLNYSLNGDKRAATTLGRDFQPYNFSGSGQTSGSVIFVGYGITAPEYDYDDYSGVDVKGRTVLILRHEPQEFDEKSRFAGKVYTTHAQMQNKAVNARLHGARAVLFVNDASNHPADADQVEKFSQNVGPNSPDIPFVQIRAELADQWLSASGQTLKQWIETVDKDLKPHSFELPKLSIELQAQVERQQRQVPNVCAYLKGSSDEYVILGAHFDHLGMGEQSSMAPSLAGKAIHHGADDNASGTAGLMELAGYFAGKDKPRRGILFLAFAGEELGLLGSNYYVNHPLLPLDKAAAMINMDMIGRIKDRRVFVGGTGTGDTLAALLDQAKAKSTLQLDLSEQGGYGSSDHFSFTLKQVPVLFFFSGLHSDYHKPSDTAEKIQNREAADLLTLVADVTSRLSDAPARPAYIKTSVPQPTATASASSSGAGVWFGSVPDMAESKDGFKLSDVLPNSPAAAAGLKGGDVIFEFDGKPVKNLYDYTYVLRSKKPGDVVDIRFRRGSETLETKATLKSRSQMR